MNEEKDRDQCRTCIGLRKIIIEDIHKSWLYCFTNRFKIPSLRGSVKHNQSCVYLRLQDVSPRAFSGDHYNENIMNSETHILFATPYRAL